MPITKTPIPLGSIVYKISRNFRDNNPAWAFGKVLALIFRPIFYCRTYLLYRADLRKEDTPPAVGTAFALCLLQPEDVELVKQIQRMEEWLACRIESVLQGGGICIVALDGDTVAGFNLISFQEICLPVVCFSRSLRPGKAFSIQITVANRYRRRGLGIALRLEAFKTLRAKGMRYLYGGTDIHNRANLALCRKLGLQGIAEVRLLKIFWRKKTFLRRVHY